MTTPVMFRTVCAALFVAAVGLAILPGCSGSAPTQAKKDEKKDDKKDDSKPGDNKPGDPKSNDQRPTDVTPTQLKPIEPEAEKVVDTFLADLIRGSARAEVLSTGFIKVVGKPVELPSDKEKGYSADAAMRWLRRACQELNFTPSQDRHQAGDAVYCRGDVYGAPRLGGKTGSYALRLVKQGGAWKVDWLGASSAEWKGKSAPGMTADAAFQEFAVVAFVSVLSDSSAMPDDARPGAIAAVMTPGLRESWAKPFEQDKQVGLDYNPELLKRKAIDYTGGTSSFTVTRLSEAPEFKVELTRPAGTKTLTVKLMKGTVPGEWLVSEVTEKG